MKKVDVELVQDFDGTCYANLFVDGNWVSGLPEYVPFGVLQDAVKQACGVVLPPLHTFKFQKFGRKKLAAFSGSLC